jgi:hypothetical protein
MLIADSEDMQNKIRSVDIEPDGHNGSHYLIVNGEQWARYNTVAQAENARETMINELAAEYDADEAAQ